MATTTLRNRFVKWVLNDNDGTRMTWWKTSFNMPVQSIFWNTNNWVEGAWPFSYYWQATSFDLSGFEVGWEVIAAFSFFKITWPFSWGTVTCSQTWKNTSGSTIFVNEFDYSFPYLADSSRWSEAVVASNQWVAPWEINKSWTYSCTLSMVWSGINSSITYNVTFTNVPSMTSYTPWMLWVEGSQLCYVSANWHLHRISGIGAGSVGSTYAWKIWCASWTNDIYWIGNGGTKYYSNSLATDYTRRTIKQVASAFSW